MKELIERRIKRLQGLLHDARTKKYHSEALREIDITGYSARLNELSLLLMVMEEKGL